LTNPLPINRADKVTSFLEEIYKSIIPPMENFLSKTGKFGKQKLENLVSKTGKFVKQNC